MPHLVILYTPNIEPLVDMTALCRSLAQTMLTVRDEQGRQVFPTGGVRVLAYPAAHHAVADTHGDYAFAYLNLRMGRGRTAEVQQAAGKALEAAAMAFFQPVLARMPIGVTLQIDVGPEVFDAKNSSLHPLFDKR